MFVLFLQLAVGLRFAVDKIADIIVSAPVSGCTRTPVLIDTLAVVDVVAIADTFV